MLFLEDGLYFKYEFVYFFVFGIISFKSEEKVICFMNIIVININ